MAEYVDIETAKQASGLRVVLTRMPGAPWTEAAKAVLDVKGIPYLRVAQQTGRTDEALREWTGIANAPIAVYDDEPPRDDWQQILHLAERLAPEPRLIPADTEDRVRMFGLAGELMSEDGLIWNRRLIMFEEGLKTDSPVAGFAKLRGKAYGYTPEAAARATGRVVEVLEVLDHQLSAQQARGSRFLIGDALSALDLYWACACAIVATLPPEQCAMPEVIRRGYENYPDAIRSTLSPALVAHRDAIYRDYLSLPIDT